MGNVTERVAIAEAMTARLQGRHGGNHKPDQGGNNSTLDNGKTRDLAAAKAGLSSGKTLEAGVSPIWGMLGRNSRGFALGFLLCRRHANRSTKPQTATMRQRKQEKRSNEKSLLAIK